MPGPTFGPSGLQIQTATEIQTEISNYLQAAFGASLQSLNGTTVVGQLVSALAQVLSSYQEGIDYAYQASTLDGAEGVNLDRLVQNLGLTRNIATGTTVTIHMANSSVGAVVIPQGAIITLGATGALFGVINATVAPPLGAVDVPVVALVTGPLEVAANQTTWAITTAFVGSNFLTLTNPAAGLTGTAQETDGELRVRTLQSAHLPGNATVDSIRAAIADLDGVTQVRVFENTKDAAGITTPVNIPLLSGHSFTAVVRGSAPSSTIGPIIYAQKAAGIGTYGDTSYTVTDADGFSTVVKYETAAPSTIFVAATITGVSSSFKATIQAAVAAYIGTTATAGLGMGSTIIAIALDAIIYDATKVNGVSTCTGITGLAFDTANPPINTANLAVAWNEYPVTVADDAHIALTFV